MGSLPAEIVTAVALFAGTNVDDIVVLSLLSASSRAGGRPRRWEIWAGQYAGFAVLVGLSVAAGRGLALVPARWLWLLALHPARPWRRQPRRPRSARCAVASSRGPRPPAAYLASPRSRSSNGADNLAAYTPFFAATGSAQVAVTLVVFAVCVAVWCLAGGLLTRHARVTARRSAGTGTGSFPRPSSLSLSTSSTRRTPRSASYGRAVNSVLLSLMCIRRAGRAPGESMSDVVIGVTARLGITARLGVTACPRPRRRCAGGQGHRFPALACRHDRLPHRDGRRDHRDLNPARQRRLAPPGAFDGAVGAVGPVESVQGGHVLVGQGEVEDLARSLRSARGGSTWG